MRGVAWEVASSRGRLLDAIARQTRKEDIIKISTVISTTYSPAAAQNNVRSVA